MESVQTPEIPVWEPEKWFGSGTLEYCHTYNHRLSGHLDPHRNRFYELNILIDGEATHTINGTGYAALLGSIFFIPPDVPHEYVAQDHATIFHALILPGFFEAYARELSALPGYSLLFEVDPYLRNESRLSLPFHLTRENYASVSPALECLLRLENTAYEGHEILKNAQLLYLIGLLSSFAFDMRSTRTRGNYPNAIPIAHSMEYIRMHSAQHLNVDELAQSVNMSRSSYMRCFSEIAGCTPMQFQTRCRVAQARRLLCYTEMSITTVALECGFYDASHFIHAFTRSEGLTPTDFRILNYHNPQYAVCTICTRPSSAVPGKKF